MSKFSEIIPYKPRAFPPKHLKRKTIAKLLRDSKKALLELADVLQYASKDHLFCLLKTEALHSLDSQKLGVTLKQFLQDKTNAPRIAQMNDYLRALEWAAKHCAKKPFSKQMLCKIHKHLKQSSSIKPELGKLRRLQNWIGPKGCTIDEAYFFPPAPKNVGPMMDQLIKYMNRTTKEPLLQLALIFAQLLIIHPFMDGNGRVARSLVPLFLYKKHLLPIPFFPVSHYFKIHKLRYFQTLYQTTESQNWTSWIAFFLKGILQASRKTKRALMKMSALDGPDFKPLLKILQDYQK